MKTNEYPLKIDGWKMIQFLSTWSLFQGTFVHFLGEHVPFQIICATVKEELEFSQRGEG